jgi:hypothetical protein
MCAPEVEFFYLRSRRPAFRTPSRSTRPATSTSPPTTSAPTSAAHHPATRGDRDPGRVLVPRGRPVAARDRPALHRRLDDGRQHHGAADDRAGGGDGVTGCTRRSCPSRWRACRARACTPTCRSVEGDDNAFYDPDDESASATRPSSFIAGLLSTPEITAVTNQLVNSYKRLVAGFEAPVHISWARNNRSALVRVPVAEAGQGEDQGTRIEYRALDPACNPYLAFSVILAAGLKGIEERLRAAARGHHQPVRDPRPSAHRRPRVAPDQPGGGARSRWSSSELVREALGEHIFEWFLRNKRAEWAGVQGARQSVRTRSLPVALVSRGTAVVLA